jgi:hypothetical protein
MTRTESRSLIDKQNRQHDAFMAKAEELTTDNSVIACLISETNLILAQVLDELIAQRER